MIYVKNIHIPKHLQVICLGKKKDIYYPTPAKLYTPTPKATNQSAKGCKDRALPIQKDILTQNVLSQAKDEKKGISEKKGACQSVAEGGEYP